MTYVAKTTQNEQNFAAQKTERTYELHMISHLSNTG